MAKKFRAQNNPNVIQSVKEAAKADTRKPDEPAGSAAKPAAEAKPAVSQTEKTPAPAAPAVSTTIKATAAPQSGGDSKAAVAATTEPAGKTAPVSTVAASEPTGNAAPSAEVVANAAAVASPPAGETAAATGAAALVSEAVSSEAAAVEALISEPVTAPSIKAAASEATEVGALVSEAATPVAAAVTGAVAEIGLVISEAPPVPAIEEAPPAPAIEHLPRPEEPRYEPPGYIRPTLENKYLNKEALRDRLWLRKEFKPIIAYVGRLDFQKGVQLIKHGIFYALQQGAQFVLLGTSPEPRINEEFWRLKQQLNDSPDCHLEIGFNEELSHLIYAGSDMIIMPSLYEPCGLTQMIALKYGTVPIVRAVGGLVDTVFDRDYSDRPWEQRNGYVFHQPDAAGLESAMLRAIGLWYSYPDEFQRLVINGMKCDYSWNYPGQHYLNIYEHIRCK